MKGLFTQEYLLENPACYSPEQIRALSFFNKEVITFEDIFKSEIPFKDKLFFLGYGCDASGEEIVRIMDKLIELLVMVYSVEELLPMCTEYFKFRHSINAGVHNTLKLGIIGFHTTNIINQTELNNALVKAIKY